MAFSSLGILQIRTNFQLQYSKFRRISKAIYGTSHVISLAEAGAIFEKDAERLIIGTSDNRKVGLSDEATDILRKERSCGRHQGIEGHAAPVAQRPITVYSTATSYEIQS
jgi:hypothetical protein